MTPQEIADALDEAPRYGEDSPEAGVWLSHALACELADALRGMDTPEVLH